MIIQPAIAGKNAGSGIDSVISQDEKVVVKIGAKREKSKRGFPR
jgi:hypothetical protein